MLFRYKITKSREYFGNLALIHYNVEIQKYNKDNMIFKWQTHKETTLKSITEILSQDYCFSGFENALVEISDSISKYGGINNMVSEYIRKVIMRDMKIEDKMIDAEKLIDNIVLTNGWNTIEIKENE